MLFGHIPAGYICTSLLLKHTAYQNITADKQYKYFLAGMIGSVFPDLDMLYFYLIDGKQHLHHSYWTHIPFFWLAILCFHLLLAKIMRNNSTRDMSILFISNVFVHLILDTISGGIYWLFPFSNNMTTLFTVPVKSTSWVFNFLFYWTITIEGALIVIATLFYKMKHFPLKK